MPDWSAESVYDETIYPLMAQIIKVCKDHEIPLVCSFQYAFSEEDGAALVTTVLTQFDRTDEVMRDLGRRHGPRLRAVTLAETIETRPDGSKHVTIRSI